MNQEINIFDRKLLKSNRQRAAKNFHKFDFLYKEIAGEIIEKVADFKQNFNSILEIGAADGFLGKKLKELKNSDSLIQADCCDEMLNLINSKDA